MIIGVSFLDVLELPQFYGLTQFELLKPQYDSDVLPHLFHLGCNIDRPFVVQACKHKRLNGEVVIGYRYCFYERTDNDWLNSNRCTMSARIASQVDKHLAADMVKMSAEGMGWSGYKNMVLAAVGKNKDGMTSNIRDLEPIEDYEASFEIMKALASIQEQVRGALIADENMLETI